MHPRKEPNVLAQETQNNDLRDTSCKHSVTDSVRRGPTSDSLAAQESRALPPAPSWSTMQSVRVPRHVS